jgi:PadR family transcriptional regulator PadR
MSRSLGVTTVMILGAVERRVCYGLDIVNRTALLPGTVYTTLRRLERRGFVEGSWEDPEIAEADRRPRRRYYTLTSSGNEALATARERFESMGVALPAGLSVVGDAER